MTKAKQAIRDKLRFLRLRANYRLYRRFIHIDGSVRCEETAVAAVAGIWQDKGFLVVMTGREADFTYCCRISGQLKKPALNLCGQLNRGMVAELGREAVVIFKHKRNQLGSDRRTIGNPETFNGYIS